MTPSPVAELLSREAEPRNSPLVARTFGEARLHTDGDVCAVAFAPDGTIRSIDETGILLHWNAGGRRLTRHYLSDLETLWAFSPDAGTLASGNDDLLLWDAIDGQLLARIPQPSWVTAIAFSPDGRTVASGHDDGSVRLFDVATHRLVGDVPAFTKPVSALAFTPNGDRIAAAGEVRAIKIYDAATHKELRNLASHTDRIAALSWNADGTILVSAEWDTSARVWRPGESDEPIMLLNGAADQVVLATFSPDGQLLATADSDDSITLWSNPAAATVRSTLRGHAAELRTLAFSHDGSRLATAGNDRVIHVWDTATGKLVAGPNQHGKHQLAYSPGAVPLIASTGASRLNVWSATTGEEVPPSGDGPAAAVAASADGRWIAVASDDHTIRLYYRTSDVSVARVLEATKPPLGALAFSPNGEHLAMASQSDGLVWIWNPASPQADPELILIEAADGCTLEAVAVHPNGQFVAAGGVDVLSTGERDGAVCVWDVPAKKKLHVFDDAATALAFDPHGRFLAGAGLEDKVFLWDLQRGELAFALEGHQERIHCVGFTPDGNYLVSGGDDCTLRLWDVLSGRLVVVREFDSPIQSLAFDPAGAFLYTGNGNTTVHEISIAGLLDD